MKSFKKNNSKTYKICFILSLGFMLMVACAAKILLLEQGIDNELYADYFVAGSQFTESSISESASKSISIVMLDPILNASTVYTKPRDFTLSKSSNMAYSVPLEDAFVKIQSPYLLTQIDSFMACRMNQIADFEIMKDINLEFVLGTLPKNAKPIRTYQLVSASVDIPDVTRYTYSFYKSGIVIQTDTPSQNRSNSKYYEVNADSYAKLLMSLDDLNRNADVWYPMWPLYAVAQNIEDVTFTSSDKKHHQTYIEPMDSRLEKWEEIPYVYPIRQGSEKIIPKNRVIKDAAIITVQFRNGVVFEIWQNGNEVLVTASNMEYNVLYQARKPDSSANLVHILDRLAQEKAVPINT